MGSTRKYWKWGWVAFVLSVVLAGSILAGCGLLTKQMTGNTSGSLNPLDELQGDGDILTGPPSLEDTLDLGTVTVGNTVTGTIRLYILRKQQGQNTFANGARVTVTFDPKQESPGPLVVTMTDSTIVLPDDWTSQKAGTLSEDYAEASVQLTATVVGNFNHVVHFDASGPKSGGGILTRGENIQVRYTVNPASDTEPPTVTITFTPDGKNGWFVTAPACGTVEATDNVGVTSLEATGGELSNIQGLGTTHVTATICVTGEGTHTVTVTAKDAAGNEGSDEEEVKIDTIPPTITITTPPNGAKYILNEPVYADYSCSDDGSGIADCSGPVANGDPIDTAAVGTYDFTVTAEDVAGNTSKLTHTYSVVLKFYGLLPPYATGRKYKIGSTFPIKWQYTDFYNVPQDSADAKPTVSIQGPYTCPAPSGGTTSLPATSGASGLRYDAAAKMWIYTWQTKGLKQGCYDINIDSVDPYPDGGPFRVNLVTR
jgi:hypothetical protein